MNSCRTSQNRSCRIYMSHVGNSKYERLGRGQIGLGKNRKSCPGKTWFLRRVQASRTGSDPPRQFFRSQIRVLKKNLHKLRFANRNPSGLDLFLDPLFGAKNQKFSLFFGKKSCFWAKKKFFNQKSTPIYSCRKWSKWSKIEASRHLPCRVLSSMWVQVWIMMRDKSSESEGRPR